jgi:hypothetical protein
MGTKNKPGKYDPLAKIKADEPFFVLRAQDDSSPKMVIEWIKENFFNVGEEKLKEAFECALSMKKYPDTKLAD